MKKNTATQPLTTPAQVIDSIAYFRGRAEAFQERADAARLSLRDCVVCAVTVHGMTEVEAARLSGVTRMTVRAWLGK